MTDKPLNTRLNTVGLSILSKKFKPNKSMMVASNVLRSEKSIPNLGS